MPLLTFVSTALVIFVAELGDKTMLTTLCLGARFKRPTLVVLSSILALAVASGIAVIVAVVLSFALPIQVILYMSGILFIVMGGHTLVFKDNDPSEYCDNPKSMLSMFSLVLFSELGDKSQIAILSIAAQSAYPILVFAGSFASFLLLSGLSAFAGDRLAERFPTRKVQIVTGVLFFVIGFLIIFNLI
ncbi:TMEM165/GDT1 family protein [Candidatus Thorarchaeota archaeon]|nr:MAG: TMEM165/GDT1 family protein [Candidatus Thorarchaeota archaeon]